MGREVPPEYSFKSSYEWNQRELEHYIKQIEPKNEPHWLAIIALMIFVIWMSMLVYTCGL